MNNTEQQISKLVEILKEKRVINDKDIQRIFNE